MNQETEEKLKIYEIINHKIEHGDSLFNTRITWFATLQALLFFPTFNELSKIIIPVIQTNKPVWQQNNVLYCFILIGLSFCLVVSISCQAAHVHINNLIKQYNQKIKRYPKRLENILIEMGSSPGIRFFGLFASFGSILVFSSFWTYLFYSYFYHNYNYISNVDCILKNLPFFINFIIDGIIIYNIVESIFDCLPFKRIIEIRNYIFNLFSISWLLAIAIWFRVYILIFDLSADIITLSKNIINFLK